MGIDKAALAVAGSGAGSGAGAPSGDVIDVLPAVVWEADALGERMLYVSPRALDLLGHDPAEWLATPAFWERHVHADDLERVNTAIAEALLALAPAYVRYRFRAADGGYRWIQDSIQVVAPRVGERRLVGVMVDISDAQLELQDLSDQRARRATGEGPGAILSSPLHKTIVDNLSDGVYYVDTGRRITYWNRGAEGLTGYAAGDAVGRPCFDNFLQHVDGEGHVLCQNGCPLEATLEDGLQREAIVYLRHANGSRRPVQVRVAPIRSESPAAIIGAVEVFSDASGLVEAQDAARIARQDALTDPLTGLANRRLLDTVLLGHREALDRAGTGFGMLLVDIDHFKQFNDRYGHDVGDIALKVVAETLAGAVRAGDTLVRWGGEEFAVVSGHVDAADLRRIAERVLALVRSTHVRVGPLIVPVRVSIGGALACAGEPPEGLFWRVDRALRDAKAGGRDRLVLAAQEPAGA
jgi:diguanylate cyclase (GGDEF)-like protein/PAS domain S-box-containing protein